MFAEKKKRVTGNGASHHAVQPSSSEVVPPVAPFDRERLYDRLVKSVHMAPRFQENAVITMLQELHDGSRGLVRVLLARPRAESGGASSTPSYTSAIHWNGRLYGFLLIASDPTRGCKINCVRGQPNRMMKIEDEGETDDPGQTHKSVPQRHDDSDHTY